MTRISKKELVEPYEDPERVLGSIRKLFKTRSLDYSSSPEFDLFSNHDKQFKEVAETMGELTIGTNGEDAIEHVENFLNIVDSLDLPNVSDNQLR
ncbi:hypothetical protein Tco_0302367, partial [Tanacetum coccineum]